MSQARRSGKANRPSVLRCAPWLAVALALFWPNGCSSTEEWQRANPTPARQATLRTTKPAETRSDPAVIEEWVAATGNTQALVPLLLGFAAGALCCLLVVMHLLPPIVKYHCAETVRQYQQFVRPESTPRVIVVERAPVQHETDSVPAAGHASSSRDAVPHAAPEWRLDTAVPSSGAASQGHASAAKRPKDLSVLQHVYEQNLQLRDRLAAQTDSPETNEKREPHEGPRRVP